MRLPFRYRATFFFGIVVLLIVGRYVPGVAAWPMAASPFIGAAAWVGSVSHKTFAGSAPYLIPALLVAISCLFRRRALCHTVCPLGFCFDALGKARRKITGSNRLPRIFHRFPRLGLLLAVFTWIGCALGVVGFIWLDPLVLFGSPFHNHVISFKYVTRIWPPLVPILIVLLGATWLLPGLWCRYFCPLGGTQDLLYYPKAIAEKSRTIRKGEEKPAVRRTERRRFLVYGVILVSFTYLFHCFRRHTNRHVRWPLIGRPPGAVDETTFFALCTRCGACVKACPTRYVVQGGGRFGWLDEGCPEVPPSSTTWCKADCNACSRVCPTGAIRKFTIEEKKNFKLGLAVLDDFERCRLYEDIECSVCQRDCPYDAVSYEWSDEEYRRIPVIDAETCTGCGRCVVTCPGLVKNSPKPLKITPLG